MKGWSRRGWDVIELQGGSCPAAELEELSPLGIVLEGDDERRGVVGGAGGDGVLVGGAKIRQVGRDEANVVGLVTAAQRRGGAAGDLDEVAAVAITCASQPVRLG